MEGKPLRGSQEKRDKEMKLLQSSKKLLKTTARNELFDI